MIEILTSNSVGLCAIGAAVAVGICGLAAGICEGGIGKTVIDKGVMEKDFGKGLLMVTIGESVVVYGFTIGMIIVATYIVG